MSNNNNGKQNTSWKSIVNGIISYGVEHNKYNNVQGIREFLLKDLSAAIVTYVPKEEDREAFKALCLQLVNVRTKEAIERKLGNVKEDMDKTAL